MKKLICILSILAGLLACNQQQVGYSGEDLTEKVTIMRNKDLNEPKLMLDVVGKWKLYEGKSVGSIDISKPILQGEGKGELVLPESSLYRSYFQLVTSNGSTILAERLLPMKGGYNFRDLGGIKTSDGKYIKWGEVFRTGDWAHLTADDLRYLHSLGLVSIVDFRTEEERIQEPSKVIDSAKVYNFTIAPGNLSISSLSELISLQKEQLDTIMMDLNRELLSDQMSIKQYQEFFALLQNQASLPLAFHCSAGKDRTGMAAALFLFALGVDEESVLNDYMQSRVFLADKYKKYVDQYPNLEPLLTVKPEYLQSGISYMKKEYGTVESYLEDVLGVDLVRMREMYLY
ncbi:tyrosine-protein phosphatase [Sphingobacterium yanglingense]|uniref:Protein tyrosine/serine phosphatase n=1 Tax=Sphingobacterium yanglingense TaxID=1437280 RepID=A0A4V3DCZ1_9SPHI|nr:tyrosine-protein phosphatase [Sphingobacterium yanglingense]TDQ73883.1 protein tyrosine/serine phosphatase [Sphingobacterium yanglingense]